MYKQIGHKRIATKQRKISDNCNFDDYCFDFKTNPKRASLNLRSSTKNILNKTPQLTD